MIEVMSTTSRLVTPWGEDLPEIPLPEYPRPMLRRAQWRCLNGPWRYAVTPMTDLGSSGTAEPHVEAWDGDILVPFAIETPASGVERALNPDEFLHYEREVEIPRAWRGRRIAINFEAVDYRCAVWIDGALVGTHRGGYLPFSVEVPDSGRETIRLRVGVADPSDSGRQQRGKQALAPTTIWYRATSGIWQTVWMEPLPDNPLTGVRVRTHDDLETVELLVTTRSEGVPVRGVIEVPGGDDLAFECTSGAPRTIRIPDARPWTPDDPHLYRLRLETEDDEAESWFGIRTVKISDPAPKGALPKKKRRSGQGRRILLNGRPFLLNAPLDQGYWPESGMTAPSEDALAFDLRTMKEMGFNGVRVHIKVESRRFYHLADRLGLVLVQDAVSGGKAPLNIKMSGVIQALDVSSPDRSRLFAWRTGRNRIEDRREFLSEWVATIRHLEAHPSILVWVPFNEGWGQFDARAVDALTRESDPTRLVDAASGWFDQGGSCGDFRSRHRYVLKLVAPTRRDPRPYYLSEFGGLNLAVEGHTREGLLPFGYGFHDDAESLAQALTALYREQLIPLVRKGLTAATYTQLSDVEQETNGLITYDRRIVKIDSALVARLNSELRTAFADANPA